MNRKKLPKAIVWTANDMREARTDGAQRREPAVVAVMSEPVAARAANIPDNVIEMVPKSDAAAATATSSPAPSAPTPEPENALLAQRRLNARAIVERHANLSAVGGIIPFPIASVVGITALIIHMMKSLSRLYGVPFERNRARSVAVGLTAGVMPSGVASIAASTLVLFIPGAGLVGLAVSSVTASAYTRGIGQTLIEHFEKGSALADFPSAKLR
jgi:uncharacterized protein (DUF697 family)